MSKEKIKDQKLASALEVFAIANSHSLLELTKVTDDIRLAEQALREFGVPIPFEYICFRREEGGSLLEHLLAWRMDQQSKQMRLIFIIQTSDAVPVVTVENPLIEAKAIHRQQLFNYLPNFLLAFSDKLNQGRKE